MKITIPNANWQCFVLVFFIYNAIHKLIKYHLCCQFGERIRIFLPFGNNSLVSLSHQWANVHTYSTPSLWLISVFRYFSSKPSLQSRNKPLEDIPPSIYQPIHPNFLYTWSPLNHTNLVSSTQFLYIVSWEPERRYHYSKMFRWKPEECGPSL